MAHEKELDLNEIKKAVADLTATVNEQAQILKKMAVHKVQDSVEFSQQKVEDVKAVIEDKPLQAVGIAALVGLVVGAIIARK